MKFATVKSGPMAGEFVRYQVGIGSPSHKLSELWWQKQRLSYTASGYGSKIPTPHMVKTIDERWRRVYCRIYSNVGTCYVIERGEAVIVEFINW